MLFHFFLIQKIAFSNEIEISGTVVDVDNHPLANAMVSLYSRKYIRSKTDHEGKFKISGNLEEVCIARKNKGENSLKLCRGNILIKNVNSLSSAEILQDSEYWKIEVLWDLSSKATMHIPGKKLAIENASYTFLTQ